jgi:biotin carboxylase
MAEHDMPAILCLASYEKGAPFLEEAKRQGLQVILITVPTLKDSPFWPRQSIDHFHVMPDLADHRAVIAGVSYLARSSRIEHVIPLDEYDLMTAAALREHLRLPGMGDSATRLVRDKLAMRVRAAAHGLPVPAFVHTLNDQAISRFMETVPAPWLIKPRSEATTIGIKKLHSADQVWKHLDELGDVRSNHLLERFLPGDVYHADSIVANGEPVFVEVHRYARPPLEVFHEGGIACTATLRRDAPEAEEIRAVNRAVLQALGVRDSAAHMEFIRAHEDGKVYFLEVAARVGGAYIADVIQAATGVNLWTEWAKLELLPPGSTYDPPVGRQDYAGVIISLARQEHPDMSAFQDPEIVWRMDKAHHVGLVVQSPDHDRVTALLDQYARRFAEDFMASLPPWVSRPPSDS